MLRKYFPGVVITVPQVEIGIAEAANAFVAHNVAAIIIRRSARDT